MDKSPRIDIIQDPDENQVIVSFGGIPVVLDLDKKGEEESDALA